LTATLPQPATADRKTSSNAVAGVTGSDGRLAAALPSTVPCPDPAMLTLIG
jgi:hypothetical protein